MVTITKKNYMHTEIKSNCKTNKGAAERKIKK